MIYDGSHGDSSISKSHSQYSHQITDAGQHDNQNGPALMLWTKQSSFNSLSHNRNIKICLHLMIYNAVNVSIRRKCLAIICTPIWQCFRTALEYFMISLTKLCLSVIADKAQKFECVALINGNEFPSFGKLISVFFSNPQDVNAAE